MFYRSFYHVNLSSYLVNDEIFPFIIKKLIVIRNSSMGYILVFHMVILCELFIEETFLGFSERIIHYFTFFLKLRRIGMYDILF